MGTRTRDPAILWLLWAASVVAIVGSFRVLDLYGGQAFWPQLAAGFLASLAAFVLALTWEAEKDRRRAGADAAALEARRLEEVAQLEERLATEIRRRLEPIREELGRNQVSLKTLAKGFRSPNEIRVLHPELLDGAWAANAPRLTEVMADYKLTSDLASTYGRIEELRWRLRQRTSTMAVMAGSDIAESLVATLEGMTAPLVKELNEEVAKLLEQVGSQIAEPDVQPLGLLHRVAMTAGVSVAGSVRAG